MSLFSFGDPLNAPAKAIGVSEIRKRIGVPQEISIWVRPMVYMALSPMVVLRGSIGVRMVNGLRLVGIFFAMLLWAFIPSVLIASVDSTGTIKFAPLFLLVLIMFGMSKEHLTTLESLFGVTNDDIFTAINGSVEFIKVVMLLMAPMVLFAMIIFILGLGHRLMRWIQRYRGEKLNTRSLGRSIFSRFGALGDNGIAERYLDAAFFLVVGFFAWKVSSIVAIWMILSAFSLYIVEKYLHELQLDQYDGLLNAEALDQISSLYLGGLTHQGGADRRLSKPIPAAITEQELARSSARRGRDARQKPSVSESVSAAMPSREPKGGLIGFIERFERVPWQLIAACVAVVVAILMVSALPERVSSPPMITKQREVAQEAPVAAPGPAASMVPVMPAASEPGRAAELPRPKEPGRPGEPSQAVAKAPPKQNPVPSREAPAVPQQPASSVAPVEVSAVRPAPVPPPVPEGGPDDIQAIQSVIERAFRIWTRQWFSDRYEPGSVRILKQAGNGNVAGQFSFVRGNQRFTIPFSAGVEKRDGDYVLTSLCYSDTTTGMRDCAR